jgi:hypothetical protein
VWNFPYRPEPEASRYPPESAKRLESMAADLSRVRRVNYEKIVTHRK